jgi:DNA repair protein REV1
MTHIIVDASRFNAAHARTSKHWNRPIVDFRWITDSDKQTKLLDVEQYLVNAAAAAGEKGNSSKDPNFVQNFFQSSRLHFLGSWKDHYEKIYEKDLKKIVPRFDFEKQRKLAMQFGKPGSRVYRRVAHIDMDSFFASVSIRDDPSLVGKPVAISHSVTPSTNSTGEVSSANYVARQYGIHAGMVI